MKIKYFINVSNECGFATDTVRITFDECDYLIFIPNAFTPNGDGVNDVLFFNSYNLIKFECWIFDGWGRYIFFTDSSKVPWKGDVNNSEYYAQDGVYQYDIRYTTNKGIAGQRRGHVTLFR